MKELFNYGFKQGQFKVYDECPNFKNLVLINQTHSNIIIEFNGELISDQEADGVIGSYKDLEHFSFGIKTADCLPILLLGQNKFALIHAGWRGLNNKILMHSLLVEVNPNIALIGPSIYQDSFEVTPEFRSHFPNSKENFTEVNGQLRFNLQDEAKTQIQNKFSQIQFIDPCICTYKNLEYRSFRRDKTHKRNWNIFLKEMSR